MKRIILCLLTMFISTCVVAGATAKKLTVMLDWFPNPNHAPLIIAQKQGYFSEQGLEVELIGPADPSDPPKMVAAGKVDIGLTYEPEYMEQVDQGLPLIQIGTLIDKPLSCLVVLKSSNIKSLADLKGKRIGSSSAGIANSLLRVMLAQAGLSTKDVEIVNVRYNITQALLSHQVDAVTGMMRNFEVPQLELKNQQVVAFFPEEHGVPNYSELIFISNTKNSKDPRISQFLAAIKKAVRYLDEHPQKAWDIFAARYPESNNALNHEAWFMTMSYFAEEPASVNTKEWKHFAEFMRENKLIKSIQPTTRYAALMHSFPA